MRSFVANPRAAEAETPPERANPLASRPSRIWDRLGLRARPRSDTLAHTVRSGARSMNDAPEEPHDDRTDTLTPGDLAKKLGTNPSLRVPALRSHARRAALVVIHGPGLGRALVLAKEGVVLTVGRNPEAALVLHDSTVSREHAEIRTSRAPNGGLAVRIRDLGGRNGTYVNGYRVREANLEHGDKLQLGEVIVRFDLLDDLDLSYQEAIAEKVGEVDLDPATGLHSKRFYLRELPERIQDWLALRLTYAIAVVDLDRFNEVNDRHGHEAGDRVLGAVGQAIRAEVRRADIAVRFGGDELVLVLPGADLSEARIVASRVRAAVRADVARMAAIDEPITVTVGVAAHHGEDSLEQVFERADAALRRAKRSGRDRVACDGDE